MSSKQALRDKTATRPVTVGVIGIGYVGLPLALLFAEKGFGVIGFDVDAGKIEALTRGESYITPDLRHRILIVPFGVYRCLRSVLPLASVRTGTAANRAQVVAAIGARHHILHYRVVGQ